MEVLHIETRYDLKVELPENLIDKLPKKLIAAVTVQLIDNIKDIKRQLEENGKDVTLFKGIHGKYEGQILGCDNFKIDEEFDAFLYVGDGIFHPRALLMENDKPVFTYNPFSNEVKRLGRGDMEYLLKRKKTALSNFYAAKRIGILVSTKPGQSFLKSAVRMKEKLKDMDKEVYLFLADNIDIGQFDNFNFIDFWINTACPRIVEDPERPIMLNIKDIALAMKENIDSIHSGYRTKTTSN